MTRIAIAAAALAAFLDTTTALACSVGQFRDNIRWCMVTGQGAIGGRGLMWDGMRKNQTGVVMSGFRICERGDAGALANGKACYDADRAMPLRLAHEATGH